MSDVGAATRVASPVHLLKALLLASLMALAGCAGGLSQSTQQALSVVVPHKVDFEELRYYGVRSKSAYDTEAQIKQDYPLVTRVRTIPSVDVRYFIETDHGTRTQTVSVRGTAEKPNIWEDIEIKLVNDAILGLQLHGGFQKDSIAVWSDMKPYLISDYDIRITGHSLGAAIALILGGYADAEGYTVKRIVNFGQPKVTNSEMSPELFEVTTRVIDDRDVVPMLPPPGYIPKYRHVAAEVILRPGADYIYLDAHDADRVSIADFWREFSDFSIKEHYMENYLANIENKIENGATQVPYLFDGI